jgi:hypothetical protein
MNARRIRNIALAALVGLTVAATSATQPVAAAGPFGPDTCKNGYVWREAAPGDNVCVTPHMRDLVAYDNSQAAARRNPHGAYGSNTCKNGYVWREAFVGDVVCVTPSMRSQVKYDNSMAAYRRAG